MKRTILLAAVLTAALAAGACANMLTDTTWTQTWLDNFDGSAISQGAYTVEVPIAKPVGTPLAPNGGWTGNGGNSAKIQYRPESAAPSSPTDITLRVDAASTVSLKRNAYKVAGQGANEDAGGLRLNRMHFEALANSTLSPTDPSDWNNWLVAASADPNYDGSNVIPAWNVAATEIRPYVSKDPDSAPNFLWIGPALNYNDGLWHSFDVIWDTVTGDAEWYKDGALVAKLSDAPNYADLKGFYLGRAVRYWQLHEQYAATEDIGMRYDDFTVYGGTPIPEPSSLVALGTLGLGMLGLIRRRRA